MRLGDNYRRMPNVEGAYGPKDDPRDDHEELFTCPGCGCSYIAGGFSAAHNFSPCPGTRCERDCWKVER